MSTIHVREYLDIQGRSPWAEWFAALDARAASKVTIAVYRIGTGNFSNMKGVGAGVMERVIDWGPGYRIYLARDGDTVVVLLGGSSKKRQQEAIEQARDRWADYRRRK
jgi:putative addiction module killer protein